MSKIGLVILMILMTGGTYAQDYFIFIHADSKTPFYTRLGDKVTSSSSGGHLILSGLKDSTYTVTIGLAGQPASERRYIISIDHQDHDYRIKGMGENSWTLNDERTAEEKQPQTAVDGGEGGIGKPPGLKKDDAFSRLMAGVVNDTSVLYNTYAMQPAAKDSPVTKAKTPPPALKETATPSPKQDSSVDTAVSTDPVAAPVMAPLTPPVTQTTNTEPIGRDTATTTAPAPRPKNVVKLSERKLPHTLRLAYADRSTGKKADTVIIFIPVDTPTVAKTQVKLPRTATDSTKKQTTPHADTPKTLAASPDTPKDQTAKTHPINPDTPKAQLPKPRQTTPDTPKNQTAELFRRPVDTPRKTQAAKTGPAFVNSDCHNFATDYDVDKLRVRLLDAPKDEDKIATAKKVFKTRCFSTKQIRALSEIFTSDAAKYRFFEAAYPFCSDDQFRELGSLLADPVYNSKFRAMTEH